MPETSFGVTHELELHDRRVAAAVRRCRQMPEQELFQYEAAAGRLHSVGSGDVDDYLAETAGEGFTAKDFRAWHVTVLALELTQGPAVRPPGPATATAGRTPVREARLPAPRPGAGPGLRHGARRRRRKSGQPGKASTFA